MDLARHFGASGTIGYGGSARLRPLELLPWILAAALYFFAPSYLPLGSYVLIMILFALSLDLVLGYAGIVTLGHAAFFGAGAYTVGMLASLFGWNEPLSGLLAAAAVAGVIGLVSGLVLLRTHGLTLLMLTLCTMALLEQAANMGADWTGGFDGIPGLSFGKILGLFSFDVLYFRSQYLYVLALLLLCFLVVRMLVYSSFGQSLTGVRENLLRMHAVGAPVRARLVIVYTISAMLAGIAGGLFTQATGYVNLSVLGLERSAGVMIILILGGYGRLYGAFVGAVAYMVLEHMLAKAYPTAWQLGIGVTLILVALYARNGIIGIGEALRRRLRGGGAA
jgi:branched-chain amino acid transport system permease protein